MSADIDQIALKDAVYTALIPVYNSEAIVADTVKQTVRFFESNGLKFEIILVNDHSTDRSWKVLEELSANDHRVVAIDLLKNYGQHSAVYCAIAHAKGDYLITLDDDLQNPPEEMIHLIRKIHEGHDAVFAEFRKKQHAFTRKIGTRIVDYLNVKVFNKPKELKLTNFRIFTAEVGQRMLQHRTSHPYIPGLVILYSSSMANVLCEHHPRQVGSSNYSLFKILQLVARLLFNYSSYPLKLLTSVGFGVSALSFLTAMFFLVKSATVGSKVQGWTSLMVLVSFLCGFIIIMLGVVGEYLARMMNQLSAKESYHVRKVINR